MSAPSKQFYLSGRRDGKSVAPSLERFTKLASMWKFPAFGDVRQHFVGQEQLVTGVTPHQLAPVDFSYVAVVSTMILGDSAVEKYEEELASALASKVRREERLTNILGDLIFCATDCSDPADAETLWARVKNLLELGADRNHRMMYAPNGPGLNALEAAAAQHLPDLARRLQEVGMRYGVVPDLGVSVLDHLDQVRPTAEWKAFSHELRTDATVFHLRDTLEKELTTVEEPTARKRL